MWLWVLYSSLIGLLKELGVVDVITVIEGLQGSGKTSLAVWWAFKRAQKRFAWFEDDLRNGRDPGDVRVFEGVYSNMQSLKFRDYYLYAVSDLLHIKNGVVILDEGHIWFWARNWARVNEKVAFFWGQVRKRGLDVFITTQSFEHIDVSIRRVVDECYRVKRLTKRFSLLLERRYNTNSYRIIGIKNISKGWDLYDHKEIITLPYEDQDNNYKQIVSNINDPYTNDRLHEIYFRLRGES